jgi:hypothetical protein
MPRILLPLVALMSSTAALAQTAPTLVASEADVTRFIAGIDNQFCVPLGSDRYYYTFDITSYLPTPPAGQRIIVDQVSAEVQSFNLHAIVSSAIYINQSSTLALPMQTVGDLETPFSTSFGHVDTARLFKALQSTSFP